jgi:myo-inositol-1(or 4)-monophosphatase
VSERSFDKALVAFGTAPYHTELAEKSMRLALAYLHTCADVRRSGSAAIDLAWLACGRHDAFFELNLKPWDYAAGSLIVREAGGEVRMPLLGTEMDFDRSTAIVAATPKVLDQVMEVFWKYNKK